MDFKAIIQKNHPEFKITEFRQLMSGWASFTFEVNGQYIFRFPRFEPVKFDLQKEIRLLPSLAKHMTVQIPDFEYVDREVPYVGYKKIDGVPIVDCDLSSDELARQVASALVEIHSFPPDRAVELDVLKIDWKKDYADFYSKARKIAIPHLDEETIKLATALFDSFLTDKRNFNFLPSLIHRDLSGEDHILCDPETNQLVGIIDWEDSCIGDPAIDFTGLHYDCGPEFTKKVLAHYEEMGGRGPKVDPTFWERNIFYHRVGHFHSIIHGLNTNDQEILNLGVKEVKEALRRERK